MVKRSWLVVSWPYKAMYSAVYHAHVSAHVNSELIKIPTRLTHGRLRFCECFVWWCSLMPLSLTAPDRWWCHEMFTFSALLALCEGNPSTPGSQWIPLTKASDVSFDLHQNKRLSKQPRRQWFETPSRSLRRHCNVYTIITWCIRWRKVVSMRYFLIEQPLLCRIGLAWGHTKTFNLTEMTQVWWLIWLVTHFGSLFFSIESMKN